jgi:hypothetical protein
MQSCKGLLKLSSTAGPAAIVDASAASRPQVCLPQLVASFDVLAPDDLTVP